VPSSVSYIKSKELIRGVSGSIASIIRLRFIGGLVQKDFLFAATDVAIWSTVEPGMGITAASLATLRPLFRNFLAKSRLCNTSTTSDDSSRPSRASYARSGKNKASTVYSPEPRTELGVLEHSTVEAPEKYRIEAIAMGDGLSKIVQTQTHAHEDEARTRKQGLTRNKTVSWGKVGVHDGRQSTLTFTPDSSDLGERSMF